MVASLLLYLLKANAALLLFAAAYFGLLRRLTFFTLNRAYLVFALLFAAGCPALPVPALLPVAAALPGLPVAGVAAAGAGNAAAAATGAAAFDWAAAGAVLYVAGAAGLLARLLVQLLSLWRLHHASRPAAAEGLPFRTLAAAAAPFSFWQTIYLNPDQHSAPELAAVLRHEQVHVRQWHTLDVLLAQLAVAAAWCNPVAWLLARALRDNLEYLADRAVLQSGLDRRAYQYSLLRLSRGAAGPSLVSHFTFLTLKTRVAMMNAPASPATHALRYLLALPLAAGLALGLAAAQTPAAAPLATRQGTLPLDAAYYLDGVLADKAAVDRLDTKALANVQMLKGEKARQVFGSQAPAAVVVVTTLANVSAPAVRALNDKIARVAPPVPGTESPAPISALVAPALAYIVKTYPDARIIGVTQLKYPSTGQTSYKVQLAVGQRPFYAFFDERGNAVKP